MGTPILIGGQHGRLTQLRARRRVENSDYVLAGGNGNQTPDPFDVISPVFAPPDGIQSGFNGDYSGITINRGEEAHPI